MKKSTLITTIAMIVVVVVALSTATYAWFSSSSASTATMSISSTATSGWSLSKGTVNTADSSVTFTSQSTALDLGEALKGLYSPNAALSTHADSNMPTSVKLTTNSQDNFYQCKTYNSNAYVTKVNTAVTPTVVRVVNNHDAEKDLVVTVFVVCSEDTTNNRYAAAGLTFYFADGNGDTYTLGYGYADATNYVASPTESQKQAYSDLKNADTANAITKTSDVEKSTTIKETRPTYATATSAGDTSGFKVPTADLKSSDNTAILTANTGIFLQYSFTIASVAKGSGINLVNYTWIDGWTADDAANGSSISIYIVFGDEQKPSANPAAMSS